MILVFVAIFTTFFIALLFLLLINTKTILKILGIVLLPLYILKFVYDSVRPPKKFQQCIYDCDETINTHSKHSKKIVFNQFKNRTLFNELMYKKRLEIELEHNDTGFSTLNGVIDLEDWKSKWFVKMDDEIQMICRKQLFNTFTDTSRSIFR